MPNYRNKNRNKNRKKHKNQQQQQQAQTTNQQNKNQQQKQHIDDEQHAVEATATTQNNCNNAPTRATAEIATISCNSTSVATAALHIAENGIECNKNTTTAATTCNVDTLPHTVTISTTSTPKAHLQTAKTQLSTNQKSNSTDTIPTSNVSALINAQHLADNQDTVQNVPVHSDNDNSLSDEVPEDLAKIAQIEKQETPQISSELQTVAATTNMGGKNSKTVLKQDIISEPIKELYTNDKQHENNIAAAEAKTLKKPTDLTAAATEQITSEPIIELPISPPAKNQKTSQQQAVQHQINIEETSHRVVDSTTAATATIDVANNNNALQQEITSEPIIELPISPPAKILNNNKQRTTQGKVIIHRIIQETPTAAAATTASATTATATAATAATATETAAAVATWPHNADKQQEVKVIIHRIHVEPDNNVTIQELSANDDSDGNADFSATHNAPLISEVESETENNSSDEISYSTAATQPLTENSKKEQRAQKRAALETHFLPQLLSPRYLDSISEENSDLSDARSDCSDNANNNNNNKTQNGAKHDEQHLPKIIKANAIFPKCQLDFSKHHKSIGLLPKSQLRDVIREEQEALILETKLVEQPQYMVDESCSRLASAQTPISEAAELVYINSSASSSVTDLMDIDDAEEAQQIHETDEYDDDAAASDSLSSAHMDLDAAVSALERISESLCSDTLSQCYSSDSSCTSNTLCDNEESSESRESTPVNAAAAATTTESTVVPMTKASLFTLPLQTNLAQIDAFENKTNANANTNVNVNNAKAISREQIEQAEKQQQKQHYEEAADTSQLVKSFDNTLSAVAAASTVRCSAEKSISQSLLPISATLKAELVGSTTNASGDSDEAEVLLYENIAKMNNVRAILENSLVNQSTTAKEDIAPPVPPPPFSNDEIDNRNALLVKSVSSSSDSHVSEVPMLNLENLKVLTPNTLTRQESNDSHCSGSTNHSQCTAINVETATTNTTDNVSDMTSSTISDNPQPQTDANIKKLRSLCTESLASLPFGEEVLVELASVAQNIGEVQAQQQLQQQQQHHSNTPTNMPYPLPTVPHIAQLQLSLHETTAPASNIIIQPTRPAPPVPAPPNSYDNSNNAWVALPTAEQPNVLVCLSPAQRNLMQTQTQQGSSSNNSTAPAMDELLDAHQKFVQRRGYHELSHEQVQEIEQQKLAEQKILKTAALMKQLRKSLSPPPPIPPPPVPIKSSETAAKVSQQIKANKDQLPQQQVAAADDASVNQSANTNSETNANGTQRLLTIIKDANEQNSSNINTNTDTDTALAKEPQAAIQSLRDWTSANTTGSSHSKTSAKPAVRTETRTLLEQHNHLQQQQQEKFDDTQSDSEMASSKLHNIEQEFARLFPTLNANTSSDAPRRRYSNIESSTHPTSDTYCSQLLSTKPKRYSSYETHSFENKKRIENGQVIYDISNAQHEKQQDGNPSEDLLSPTATEGYNNANKTANKDIMSAFKINTPTTTTASSNSQREQQSATLNKDININGFGKNDAHSEESGQHANKTNAAINTGGISAAAYHFDHEKLFKDFDDLSKQLHLELQKGKVEKEMRQKSASLYDLSRTRFAEQRKQRHEHMQELEREIERSMQSRRQKTPTNSSFQIPIKIEQATQGQPAAERVHHIPVQLEPLSAQQHQQQQQEFDARRFRRAESMHNLDNNYVHAPQRQRTQSSNYDSQQQQQQQRQFYEQPFDSVDYISKPLAREVEICYQRQQRPHGIRAPRLSMSTNDLSSNSTHTFDQHNAYNVPRSMPHAPMLSQMPSKHKPQYASCYSVLQRDPNPTYISTTSRRGVSPAPATQQQQQQSTYNSSWHDEQRQQRRASLPREIQEQQLKYIASKEQELQQEFERLQTERRRLLEELQMTSNVQLPQRSPREIYRAPPKLPTLTENEVFRQQMAEEWINKVAEREERRLQKIIKISNAHSGIAADHNNSEAPQVPTRSNISDEFLTRVKERRHKLHMPADSDWESGAESQPVTRENGSESEEAPNVQIVGAKKQQLNYKQLPQHLREFAKFSNHNESEENGVRQLQHEEAQEERVQETNDNSMCSGSKKSAIVKTIKISRLPPSIVNAGRPQSHQQQAFVSTAGGEANDSVYESAPASVASPVFSTTPEPEHANINSNNIFKFNTTTETTSPSTAEPNKPTTTTTPYSTYSSSFASSAFNDNNNYFQFPSFTHQPNTNNNNFPTTPPMFSKLQASLDEMFQSSPLKNHIHEEFENHWRRLNNNFQKF